MQKIKKTVLATFWKIANCSNAPLTARVNCQNIISLHLKKIDKVALFLKTRKVG